MAVTVNEWLCFLADHETVQHRKYALQFAIKQIEEWGTIDCVGIPRGGWVYQQVVVFSPVLLDAETIMDASSLLVYNARPDDSKIHPSDDPESEYFDPEEEEESDEEIVEYMLTDREWIWSNRFRAPERQVLRALGQPTRGNRDIWKNFNHQGRRITKACIMNNPKMLNAVLEWYHS